MQARALAIAWTAAVCAGPAAGMETAEWRVTQTAVEGRARTLTVVFADELWAAWDKDSCTFLAAWREKPPGEPQTLARSSARPLAWQLRQGTERIDLEPRFRSYRRRGDGRLILDCQLQRPGEKPIWIEELPELARGERGVLGLRRTFRAFDVPASADLLLDVSLQPAPSRRHVDTDGDLTHNRQLRRRLNRLTGRNETVDAELLLHPAAATRLTILFDPITPAPPTEDAPAATASPANGETDSAVAAEVAIEEDFDILPAGEAGEVLLQRGLTLRTWDIGEPMATIEPIARGERPNVSTVIPVVDLHTVRDFHGPLDLFRSQVSGFLLVETAGEYEIRMTADDGADLWLDHQRLLEHPGTLTTHQLSATVSLDRGRHSLRIEHFENLGSQILRLEWRPPGADDFELVPARNLASSAGGFDLTAPGRKALEASSSDGADRFSVTGMHPSFQSQPLRLPRSAGAITGVEVLGNGRLLLCTAGPAGEVWLVEGIDDVAGSADAAGRGGPDGIVTVTTIASGLHYPLAVTATGREIFVLGPVELLQLRDVDGDEVVDEHWTVASGWQRPQPPGSTGSPGSAVGALARMAGGFLATIGMANGETAAETSVLVIEDGGAWRPYNRSTDSEPPHPIPTPAFLSVPGLGPGIRPGAPLRLDRGPLGESRYSGQLIVALNGSGDLARVFLDGPSQGALIPFARLGGAAALGVSALDKEGNPWVQIMNADESGELLFERLRYTGATTFEILAVRAHSNGFEIELTEPLAGAIGWEPSDYRLSQEWREPTGNPEEPYEKRSELLRVLSASVSFDRRRIFLETPPAREGSVVHLRMTGPFVGISGRRAWASEAWYVLDRLPSSRGEVLPGPILASPNTLTETERRNRWRLLFDGKSLDGWRGYQSTAPPSAWRAGDGLLYAGKNGEHGDLVTVRRYSDFELILEWAVAPGGNSGILFRVGLHRDASHWTGPEYQILDQAQAPDLGATASNYALHAPRFHVARGPLEFNHTRIVVEGNHVEHWLNGYKVVDYELGDEDWNDRVASSKFADHPDYGRLRNGYIVLQDHGDEVWFRSLRIRDL